MFWSVRSNAAAQALIPPPSPISESSVAKADLIVVITSSHSTKIPMEPNLQFVLPTGKKLARSLAAQSINSTAQLIEGHDISFSDFKSLMDRLSDKAQPNVERMIFVFSGYVSAYGLYLRDELIENDKLYSYLKSIHAREKVVIMDSCFTGTPPRLGVSTLTSRSLPRLVFDGSTGMAFLLSSATRSGRFESMNLRLARGLRALQKVEVAALIGLADML